MKRHIWRFSSVTYWPYNSILAAVCCCWWWRIELCWFRRDNHCSLGFFWLLLGENGLHPRDNSALADDSDADARCCYCCCCSMLLLLLLPILRLLMLLLLLLQLSGSTGALSDHSCWCFSISRISNTALSTIDSDHLLLLMVPNLLLGRAGGLNFGCLADC